MYLTVVAMASLLVMAFNLNSNMNASTNAYASILSDIQYADDVGQSLECVIVVVGCDGTGSVDSSGDVIIGSFNENNTVNNAPRPEPLTCEECFTDNLTPEEIIMLENAGFIGVDSACAVTPQLSPEELIAELDYFEEVMLNNGIDADTAEAVVDCLYEVFL